MVKLGQVDLFLLNMKWRSFHIPSGARTGPRPVQPVGAWDFSDFHGDNMGYTTNYHQKLEDIPYTHIIILRMVKSLFFGLCNELFEVVLISFGFPLWYR